LSKYATAQEQIFPQRRGISAHFFNFINNEMLFDLERVFSTDFIRKVAQPLRKIESKFMLSFCEQNKKNWVGWIEKPMLPSFAYDSDFAEILFNSGSKCLVN